MQSRSPGSTAYQAVFLTPILAVYLFEQRRDANRGMVRDPRGAARDRAGSSSSAPRSGTLPAAVLAGYMQTYGLEDVREKLRSAAALVVHSGWIVSPLIVLVAFRARTKRWRWFGGGRRGGGLYDPNPLFWASFGCGVLVLSRVFRAANSWKPGC